ncbi:Quinate permease [Dissostichus eleginoides]|uniref:Quinate permease n=1 Tax=Dissostichus eleginoides TaxID=100907 RepID=A0AAD9CMK8_DISEL|nr:Quinate permease [Dissostichus eleginoides]
MKRLSGDSTYGSQNSSHDSTKVLPYYMAVLQTNVIRSQNKHSLFDFFRGDIFFKADSSYSNSAYACLLFQSVDAEDTHVMLAADGSQRKVASEMINMIND